MNLLAIKETHGIVKKGCKVVSCEILDFTCWRPWC